MLQRAVRMTSGWALCLLGIVGLGVVSTQADDFMDPAGGNVSFFEVQDVEQRGDRLYAFTISGLGIIDISDPYAPEVIGRFPPPPGTLVRFYRGDAGGGFVYGGGRWELLRIIDATDETNPQLGRVHGEEGMSYEGALLMGDILYAARHADGIEVLDVSDPPNPDVLAEVMTLQNSWDLAIAAGHAYVADGGGGLAVLDLADPAHPVHLYSLPTAGAAQDVAITGDLAVVACGSAGLEIFDIGDPLNVAWRGNYNSSGLAVVVETEGERAYVADWDDIEVVDLSVPESPSRLAWEDTPVRSMGLAADGDICYVADWSRVRIYGYGATSTGDIHLPFHALNFGSVPVNATVDTTFTINNTGGGALQVTDIASFNENFVVVPPTNFSIPPGGSHAVTLQFTHAAPGYDGTFIGVYCDDPDEPDLAFAVGADDNPEYLDIGEQAPDFELFDMDGMSHRLSDYQGQVVVLAFFANW